MERLAELANRMGEIGREGAVEVRLERREVNVDDLVVRGVGVTAQQVAKEVGLARDARATGGDQVVVHALVVREDRGRGADLGSHVADGGHAGARDRVDSRAKVLDDEARATLDGQEAGELEDHVLGRRPAVELAREVDANVVGRLELPRQVGHDVDRIGTTDADRTHAEATGVRRVAVGTDHQATGERVVLEDDLVDDTAARAPEAHAVLGAGARKKVVHLLVLAAGHGEILATTGLGGDQVVAMDRGRHGRARKARRDELQHSHLRRGILHRNAVRAEVQVRLTTLDVLLLGLVQMAVENLLAESQRTIQAIAKSTRTPRAHQEHTNIAKVSAALESEYAVLSSIHTGQS